MIAEGLGNDICIFTSLLGCSGFHRGHWIPSGVISNASNFHIWSGTILIVK